MNRAKLVLIPTPLFDEHRLPMDTFEVLKEASVKLLAEEKIAIVGEDLRPTRSRWIKWGLDRQIIPHLRFLNENDSGDTELELQSLLKSGGTVYLFSDGGMPSFCDPGTSLVQFCHDHNIKVTATSCDNSVILALALSAASDRFYFASFPPKKEEERKAYLKECLLKKETVVILDTPYRLNRLVQELCTLSGGINRSVFIAMDLNNPNEELMNTDLATLKKNSFDFGKREFVLILKAHR